MISEADKAIWHELDDLSRHMLDPTIPWEPKTWQQEAIAALVAEGKLVDSGRRRRGERSGKLCIVWVSSKFAGHA